MNDINWKERCEEAEMALANALADESGLKQADQLMMNKLQRIQELEEINESHRKINGDLRRQITALEQEKLELFLDNKKLAKQVEDHLDRLRKSGM
jgi:DNA anti-recombination protein RmuC